MNKANMRMRHGGLAAAARVAAIIKACAIDTGAQVKVLGNG